MKAAFVFPGQGSQFVGMGKDLAEAYPRIAEIYSEADEILGFPISKLCFEGDPAVLTQTRNAQPAILLHSISVLELLSGPTVGHGQRVLALDASSLPDADEGARVEHVGLFEARNVLLQEPGDGFELTTSFDRGAGEVLG